MLVYDNSAFYFFSISVLTFYLVPSYYYILSSYYDVALKRRKDEDLGAVVRTSAEKEKASKIKSEARDVRNLFTFSFNVNLGVTAVLTLLYAFMITQLMTTSEIASFDPYEILGIPSDADLKTIKQAYRRKTLVYHPDKNPDNAKAADMFMRLAKAYDSLTDETARENYKKYGNPDGKQALEVAIGLPAFLLGSENRLTILMTYLFGMVVLIPTGVYMWYANTSKYGDKGIMFKTWAWINYNIDSASASVDIKKLPEVLAGCAEYHERNTPSADKFEQEVKDLEELLNSGVKNGMDKPKYVIDFSSVEGLKKDKKATGIFIVYKGNALLHSHLFRKTASLSGRFAADLRFMLAGSSKLVEAMIEHCITQQRLDKAWEVIRFNQLLAQALFFEKGGPSAAVVAPNAMMQLPHCGLDAANCLVRQVKVVAEANAEKDEAAALSAGRDYAKKTPKYYADSGNALKELLRFSDADKAKLLDATEPAFDAAQKEDVLKALAVIPRISVKVVARTDDDSDARVYAGDLMTVGVTIDRENLKKGEKAGPAHAPYFPTAKAEVWWVFLATKEKKMIHYERISKTDKIVSHEFKFQAPPIPPNQTKGHYSLDVYVMSGSYVGLDEEVNLDFDVLDASTLPVHKIHEADLELEKDPTLFEQIMQANNIEESDGEDSEDDEDSKKKKTKEPTTGAEKKKLEAAKKKQDKKKAGKDSDSDSSDDDECD